MGVCWPRAPTVLRSSGWWTPTVRRCSSAVRAHALVARLKTLFPERELAADDAWPPATATAMIVNATPIRDEVIVSLDGVEQVVDLAYNRDGTPTALVAAAREAGCGRPVEGADVL